MRRRKQPLPPPPENPRLPFGLGLLRNVLLLALVQLPLLASDWTREDTIRQIVFTAVQFVDWKQTREIAITPGMWETNPLMGRFPSRAKINRHAIGMTLLNFGIAYALPPKQRKTFQYATIAIEAGYVAHNYRIGVRFSF